MNTISGIFSLLLFPNQARIFAKEMINTMVITIFFSSLIGLKFLKLNLLFYQRKLIYKDFACKVTKIFYLFLFFCSYFYTIYYFLTNQDDFNNEFPVFNVVQSHIIIWCPCAYRCRAGSDCVPGGRAGGLRGCLPRTIRQVIPPTVITYRGSKSCRLL